jgi:cytochrome c oxidase subunit 1
MAIGRHPLPQAPSQRALLRRPTAETGLLSWLTTVDHKRLGILYFLTTFAFFLLGSLEAFVIRLQLAAPTQQLVSPDLYNQLFTVHGVTMIFLAVMPLGTAFANYFVPLQIGARDLAFPRLNAFGYWAYLAGGLILYSSFLLGGAPDAGWFAYAPMTLRDHSPTAGIDFYVVGLLVSGIGTLVTAMNLIVTIINMRAPGMSMMRMPLFPWMMLVTSFLVIFAFPPLTIALIQLLMDRTFGTLFFNPEAGGLPILWQHLFWIFGHPEVYIVILPAFGIISEVIPTFSRKPLFGYPLVVLAGIFIGFMGFAVWSHHMFTTGLGPMANAAFAITSFIIAIPTGVKIFNWIATMWAGRIWFTTAMLFAVAFIFTFTLGGITGIMVAVPPFDAQAQDSYFVVAHFHYVMGGGALLSFFAGIYYWFPKMTGRLLSERLGRWVFALVVGGFHLVFFPQHFLGLNGMPRRIQTYEAGIGWDLYNFLSTIGVFILGAGVLVFIYSLLRDLRHGEVAGDDPWDGRTLEWSIPSPPPHYDFADLPVVQDRDPVWLAKHPELVEKRDPLSEETDDMADASNTPDKADLSIHLPGQSWYPFLASVGLFVGGFALIYQNWLLGILALGFITLCIYAWAFEGIGGTYITLDPEKRRNTGLAAIRPKEAISPKETKGAS